MNYRIVGIVGLALALWMAAGRWIFGIGGSLTLWYLPTIGLGYAFLQLWLARRLRITKALGKRNRRSVYVSMWLSWACAVCFGFTVPDATPDGLMSMISLWSGSAFSAEMSIALCNPFGIIAFTMAIFALGFAFADVRERVDEDEFDGGSGPIQMVPHPLA